MAQPKIIYRDMAVGASEASTAVMRDLQPFCDLTDLKETITLPKAATLETNFWALDGTFGVVPSDYTGTWGAWSQSLTGENGDFEHPVILTLPLSGLFSSVGIRFEFYPYSDQGYCNDLNIKWYRDTELLDNKDFTPDNWQYSCINQVENYNRIRVTFRSLSAGNRFFKLQGRMFGITREFLRQEIKSISAYVSASLISDTVEVDSAEIVLRKVTDIPYMFQRKQPLEYYDGDTLLHVFYISTSIKSGSYDIPAEDLTQILDESEHKGGVYDNVLISDLIAEIMGPYEYELDPSYANVRRSGRLPIASRRENLAQVTFSIGAMVDTAGSHKTRIFPPATTVSSVFDGDHVHTGGSISTAALVTGVEITAHKYAAGTESVELYNGTLNGAKEIKFNADPMSSLSISGGTITKSNANYAVISGTGGTVVLTGLKYTHTTSMASVTNPVVGANDITNVKQVADVTIISPECAAEVAQRVYDYYQMRRTVTAEVILDTEKPGDKVTVATKEDGLLTGTLLSMEMIQGASKRRATIKVLCN